MRPSHRRAGGLWRPRSRRTSTVGRRRAYRAVFHGGGVIAIVAGLHTVLVGGKSVAGEGLANPAVESELRFYGAFYAVYGVIVLRVASHADRDADAVRALAGTLLLAGLARAGGWLAVGAPHPAQRGLLAIELAGPPLVVAWQARLAASS